MVILDQLGGNKFIAMTGAKQFVRDGDSMLQFSLPRGFAKNKANKVRVELNANDLYDLKFYYIRGVNVHLISTSYNVGAGELQAVFTRETGLDTRL